MEDKLNFTDKPTLKDLQDYVEKMEKVRGFSRETILDKCLMLGEEVGELFKAVRKSTGIKVDHKNSKFKEIKYELADILIFILSIANKYNIDLEDALKEKEEINKKRIWS